MGPICQCALDGRGSEWVEILYLNVTASVLVRLIGDDGPSVVDHLHLLDKQPGDNPSVVHIPFSSRS